ncbi:ABC transporter permease [Streptomyces sp. DH12]|uniref:ABC transporter permease n=1 Tax=Streptomyces sp. DH12 TaxID=2857010 RepID=UPI001E4B7F89|nr:ABC transporter permease [Streptomyces sp. DH12]
MTSGADSVSSTRGSEFAHAVADTLAMAYRNVLHMSRLPEVLVFGLLQPVMFVLLFSYLFGGSMEVAGTTDPGVYREFVMAGIFAQSVSFATVSASAGIADDIHKGLIYRFRSLPMSRSSVLSGRTLADSARSVLSIAILSVVATLVGWRIHLGIAKALGAFALLVLLGYAFSWVGALIGLWARSPEAATTGGVVWLFPVVFISNAFLDLRNMHPFLRAIAEWNPFSATVQGCRQLFGNPGVAESAAWPMQHPIWASLVWSILIIAVFRAAAVYKYRTLTL